MTRTAINAWRTVATVLGVVLVLALIFAFQSYRGWTESAANAFASLAMWASLAATGQAAKGTVEALANGSGVAGVKAAILTDAKPGDASPPETP